MRTRIVYYSRTGATRLLAEALAARMVAELDEITCARYPLGLWGYLTAGRDSWRKERPAISVEMDDDAVDCLLVGTPVWSGQPAAPVRSFLAGLQAPPGKVGLFLTSGGPGPHAAVEAEVSGLLGRAPDAVMSLRGADVRAGAHMDEIDDFLRTLAHPA